MIWIQNKPKENYQRGSNDKDKPLSYKDYEVLATKFKWPESSPVERLHRDMVWYCQVCCFGLQNDSSFLQKIWKERFTMNVYFYHLFDGIIGRTLSYVEPCYLRLQSTDTSAVMMRNMKRQYEVKYYYYLTFLFARKISQ